MGGDLRADPQLAGGTEYSKSKTKILKYSLNFFASFQSLEEVHLIWYGLFCFFSENLSLLRDVPTNQRSDLHDQVSKYFYMHNLVHKFADN